MATIEFDEQPVLIRVYPENGSPKDKDDVNYLEHLFNYDKKKLQRFTVEEALDYVLDHAKVNNDNEDAKRDITQARDNKGYGIEIYQHLLQPQMDESGRILVDPRKNLVCESEYWDLVEDANFTKMNLCEMRVVSEPLDNGLEAVLRK